MTFLNPLLLFGLAAATLPLLIHLLNLRRLNTIEFSSLRFLKELQQTRIRRLKIRQILLLIVRTLLVIFLVLTFSRPALEGNLAGAIGTNARSTMVVLLDDSPSMTVRTERGVLFTQAVDAVREVVGLAKPGDELYFLALSDIRLSETTVSASTPESIENILITIQPSHITVPYLEAAARINSILAESPNINKEVYFVSDGQETQFRKELSDTTLHFTKDVRVFFVGIPGPPTSQNLGISSVSASAQLISPTRPITYDVLVRNGGSTTVENTVMSLYLDGVRTVQQSVNMPGESSGSFSFNIVPKKTGLLRGTIELEEDLFHLDNQRYFSLAVPSRIRVGLVGTVGDTRYLQFALSAVENLSTDGFFAPTRIDETVLGSIDLTSFDILFLSNIKDLTRQEGDRLVRFVTGGGGLAVFPGEQTDLTSINTNLLTGLSVPPMSGKVVLDPSVPATGSHEGRVTFSKVDLAHPLFAGLFEEQIGGEEKNREIESPLIITHVRMTPGSRGNAIVVLNNGFPFLVEHPAGTGRLLLFAVDPGLSWSDFALKGIFAPLIHRSSVYLATGQEEQAGTIVGSPATITVRISADPGLSYSILTPDEVRERVNPELNPFSGMTAFTTPPTRKVGLYELSADDGDGTLLGVAAVNIDPGESVLRTEEDEMIQKFFMALGIEQNKTTLVREPNAIQRVVVGSRFGVELWKLMLSAAIFLALCEMAIARVSKNESLTGAEKE